MSILHYLKRIIFCCSVLVLTQCTKISTESHLQVSQQLASPYTMPASAYLALAKNQTGNEKQSLLILASGRLIYDGQWREGLNILSQTHELSDGLMKEKNLLLAKVDLIREQPRAAIAKLANVGDVNGLPIYHQVQFHEMLAHAYQLVGQPSESVIERIKLENLLPDEASRANNRRALWLSLTTLPQPELETLAAESANNSVLSGWMNLALISRKKYENPDVVFQEIKRWQAQYPNHPANHILPSPLESIRPQLFAAPRQIALLLPLSGPLTGPGNAIKDGFMAAYEDGGKSSFIKVRTYDTYNADISSLYTQAINDGAEYVVGPLSKTEVASIAKGEHPVPTLLLNDLETKTGLNAYQFGLSPTNEARQVAVRARKNGYSRALIITPTGNWGDDVANAFSSQWRANGGHVVDIMHFSPQDDLNASIRTFLQVTDSEAREKQLKRLLGSSIEATPTRRQDFDVIFLVAYPSKARQIMPLLKYYYASDVPVYATSTVYAGNANTMRDRDLDGIIFCDMPWVFTHQMGSRNWPEQFNSYNRLYALGMDSYALSYQLNQLLLFPALGVSDKSGVLYLNSTHQIARILTFGQFRQGLAQMLNDAKNM